MNVSSFRHRVRTGGGHRSKNHNSASARFALVVLLMTVTASAAAADVKADFTLAFSEREDNSFPDEHVSTPRTEQAPPAVSSSFLSIKDEETILSEDIIEWKPVLRQTCKDSNQIFEISGLQGKKNCKWALKKDKDLRCRKHPELRHNCQKLCNTCCTDTSLKFGISGIDGEKSCLWVLRKDKHARCSRHSEVRHYCPETCELCEVERDRKPPPNMCKDAPEKFYVHGIRSKKTCIWASLESTSVRCERYPEVKHSCPKTCGTCCKDTLEKFEISEIGGEKSCLWALKKHTADRCSQYPELRLHCPDTCNVCGSSVSFSTFASEML